MRVLERTELDIVSGGPGPLVVIGGGAVMGAGSYAIHQLVTGQPITGSGLFGGMVGGATAGFFGVLGAPVAVSGALGAVNGGLGQNIGQLYGRMVL